MSFQAVNLKELKAGDSFNGLIYIQEYSVPAATSKAPLYGKALYAGKSMPFKIWDKALQLVFSQHDLVGTIVYATGDVGEYKSKVEMTCLSLDFGHGVTDTSMFFKSADIDSLQAEFMGFIGSNISSQYHPILNLIFGGTVNNQPVFDAFKKTWAGAYMHDAQVGGLLNHTMKMMRLARTLVGNDPRLEPFKDLLYVGIILHDVGKILEISQGGTYTENSFVTHRTMGMEFIFPHKQAITDAVGEKFYYQILAIQQGHHGEYGDKPTTVGAKIVHLIDMLECHVTAFLDRLENGELSEKNGNQVWYTDGTNLVV